MTIKFAGLLTVFVLASGLAAPNANTQTPLQIVVLAEKQVVELPPGELFWRIETFSTPAQAQAAAGKWALVAESAGKIWLFTLGAKGAPTAGGTPIAEVGPIASFAAPRYLLRINQASGPPGSVTSVHKHAGSEAFFVLTGEQSIRSPAGVMSIKAGQVEAGHGPNMPMQVSSSGTTDLNSLVMFVVDATQPFSSPASFP